jgi:hypothetical protein
LFINTGTIIREKEEEEKEAQERGSRLGLSGSRFML